MTDGLSDIQLGDILLDHSCSYCDGQGMFYNTDYQRWIDGGEKGKEPPDYLSCGECDGKGRLPTVAGQAILALVRRYIAK